MKYLDKKEQILFLDNHILIAYKRAGLLTQEANYHTNSLDKFIKAWVKEKFSKKGNVFAHPIHRLDKPVSGLVIFALSSKALSRLAAMVREREIYREYLCWIEGNCDKLQGLLEDYLLHKEHRAIIFSPEHSSFSYALSDKTSHYVEAPSIFESEKRGKLASLRFFKLKELEGKTLCKIELITGRYHQIRAQMAYHFGPIVGDRKYGSRTKIANDQIFLHNSLIRFTHPVTGAKLLFEISPPFEM